MSYVCDHSNMPNVFAMCDIMSTDAVGAVFALEVQHVAPSVQPARYATACAVTAVSHDCMLLIEA